MYFDNRKNFPDGIFHPKLVWEFDPDEFDFKGMMDVILQRVIKRGWPNGWHFILKEYGIDGVKSAIKSLPYLNDKDMNFVSHQFNIPLTSMKCYEKKQSMNLHWKV